MNDEPKDLTEAEVHAELHGEQLSEEIAKGDANVAALQTAATASTDGKPDAPIAVAPTELEKLVDIALKCGCGDALGVQIPLTDFATTDVRDLVTGVVEHLTAAWFHHLDCVGNALERRRQVPLAKRGNVPSVEDVVKAFHGHEQCSLRVAPKAPTVPA